MMVGPSTGRSEIEALDTAAKSSPRCAIGLHVTLSAPFRRVRQPQSPWLAPERSAQHWR